MFVRPCYRSKNGKRHAYWALVESYRTERGPRQRSGTIARETAYEEHHEESASPSEIPEVVRRAADSNVPSLLVRAAG